MLSHGIIPLISSPVGGLLRSGSGNEGGKSEEEVSRCMYASYLRHGSNVVGATRGVQGDVWKGSGEGWGVKKLARVSHVDW